MKHSTIHQVLRTQQEEHLSKSSLKQKVNINTKDFKPFGYPVYVLKAALQQNNPHHKWKERANVGIYMGKSPQHCRNVSLVMDLTTYLVSPQSHVKHDPSFDVV